MNLAEMIGAGGPDVQLRQAVVIGTPAGGVATLRFADETTAAAVTTDGIRVETGSTADDDIPGVRCLGAAIADGDAVWVLQRGGVLLVLGAVGPPAEGGGGVTDHGALTGLADDDHPQYATDADLTTHAATAGHTHPNLATHDALGLATDAELATHAAAADPHTGYQKESDLFDATAPTTSAFADAAAAGAATTAARRDHRHGREANPVTAHEAAADPHTGYLKETDVSGLATPAIVLGTAAAAGTGTTPIRHNATIAAFDATAPSTQAFADAAVVGTVAFAARRDHKHAMPANPVTAHEAAADPHTGYLQESANVHLATFNTPGTLTVVAGKGRFRFPFAVTILGVTAAINTAPTGAAVILDVNKNGTTIFTTQGNRPTIAISGFATTTEPAPDVTAMAAGDYLTVDVDQIGSTIPGADLTVFVRYRP